MIRVPVVVEVGPLADEQDAEMLVKILNGEWPLSAGAFYRWPLREQACKFFDGDDTPIRPARMSKVRNFREGEPDALIGPEEFGSDHRSARGIESEQVADGEEDDDESVIGDEIVPSFQANDPVECWYVQFADAWPSDPVEITKRAALIYAIMMLRGFEGVSPYYESNVIQRNEGALEVARALVLDALAEEVVKAAPDVEVYVSSGSGAFFDAFGTLAKDDALREVLRDGVERVALFDASETFDENMSFDLAELLESDGARGTTAHQNPER
jgi:hypothetical protein